jgi:hypothetical protein
MNRLEEQLRIYMIEGALLEARNRRQQKKADKKAENSSPSPRPMTSAEVDAAADEVDNSGLTMFDTAPPSGMESPKEDDKPYTFSGPTWQERQQEKEKQKEKAKKKGGGFLGVFGKGKGTESSGDDKPKVTGKSKRDQRMDDIRSGKGTPEVTDADAEKPKDLPFGTKVGLGIGDYLAGAGGALLYNLGGKAFGLAYRESGIDAGMRSSPEFTDFGPKSMNIKGAQQLARAFNPGRAVIDAAQTGLADRRTKSRAASYEKLGLDKEAAKKGAEKDVQGGLLKNFAKTTADLDEPDIDKLITRAVEKRLIQRQQRVAPSGN